MLKALAMLLALPLALPSAAGQQIPAPPLAPDFSAVTTRAAAGKLVRKRQLVKIHFFPTALGGQNIKYNIGYVTRRPPPPMRS